MLKGLLTLRSASAPSVPPPVSQHARHFHPSPLSISTIGSVTKRNISKFLENYKITHEFVD